MKYSCHRSKKIFLPFGKLRCPIAQHLIYIGSSACIFRSLMLCLWRNPREWGIRFLSPLQSYLLFMDDLALGGVTKICKQFWLFRPSIVLCYYRLTLSLWVIVVLAITARPRKRRKMGGRVLDTFRFFGILWYYLRKPQEITDYKVWLLSRSSMSLM